VAFFLNTPHASNCFLLGQDKNGHGTISWLHVPAVVHNSATMRQTHEIVDCITYVATTPIIYTQIINTFSNLRLNFSQHPWHSPWGMSIMGYVLLSHTIRFRATTPAYAISLCHY
jgi:hypothetical protein